MHAEDKAYLNSTGHKLKHFAMTVVRRIPYLLYVRRCPRFMKHVIKHMRSITIHHKAILANVHSVSKKLFEDSVL